MVKFYVKTVIGSFLMTVFAMFMLDLVKGVNLSGVEQKYFLAPLIISFFFIYINEKGTNREIWRWYHYTLLSIIGVMSVSLVILL
jgi:hypothetical protein